MSQHTPGPWVVVYGQSGYPRGISAPHDMHAPGGVGHIVRQNGIGLPSSPVAKANARLIAAAPDLLEALRLVVAIADRKTDEFDRAKAAITKATGADLSTVAPAVKGRR